MTNYFEEFNLAYKRREIEKLTEEGNISLDDYCLELAKDICEAEDCNFNGLKFHKEKGYNFGYVGRFVQYKGVKYFLYLKQSISLDAWEDIKNDKNSLFGLCKKLYISKKLSVYALNEAYTIIKRDVSIIECLAQNREGRVYFSNYDDVVLKLKLYLGNDIRRAKNIILGNILLTNNNRVLMAINQNIRESLIYASKYIEESTLLLEKL